MRFVEESGKSFQIKDDIINIDSELFKKGKGSPGEDITEGKITIMVLHFNETCLNQEKKKDFFKILRSKTYDIEKIEYAIKLMRDNGSIEYANNKCIDYNKKAIAYLDNYRDLLNDNNLREGKWIKERNEILDS